MYLSKASYKATNITHEKPAAVAIRIEALERVETVFSYISRWEYPYDIFLSIAPTERGAVEEMLNHFGLVATITHHSADPVASLFSYWQLICDIEAQGYDTLCKIEISLRTPQEVFDCGVDSIIAHPSAVTEITKSFKSNSELSIIGSGLLLLPESVELEFEQTTLLSEMRACIGSRTELSNNQWGYFAGGMFWVRAAHFAHLIRCMLNRNTGAFKRLKGNAYNLAERLYGLVGGINGGTVGTLDYLLQKESGSIVLRNDSGLRPSAVPIHQRIRIFRQINMGMATKVHLLQKSRALDPYYYLTKEPGLLDGDIDCNEHYIRNMPAFGINRFHGSGKLKLVFTNRALHLITEARTNTIPLDIDFATELLHPSLADSSTYKHSQYRIKVSVICITYNHERFIKQAIQSVLAQQTSFNFELIVGDDCSTDSTPDIVQEYADRYPNKIVFVRRSKNIGARANMLHLRRLAKGQYVAINEGDDYWIDPNKLQIQSDYLDRHHECSVCFHPVLVEHEGRRERRDIFPRQTKGTKFTIDALMASNFIQTNSVMYRWRFHHMEDAFYATSDLAPGDWYNHILHAVHGEIHMLERVMAAYRRHDGGIWSTSHTHQARMKKWGLQHIDFFRCVNQNLGNYFHIKNVRSMRAIFLTLAREYFRLNDTENLFTLIDRNRDIAPIAFHKLGWNIDINKIRDENTLIAEFRRKIRISTIITSYNHSKFIAQCIDSVVSQQGLFQHDVVIADDASKDDTPSVISSYQLRYPGMIKVLDTPKNLGMLHNMKRAFAATSGSFIAICEGDDYWMSPLKLQKQLSFLQERPELQMCFNWLMLYKQGESTFVPHSQQGAIQGDRVSFDEMLLTDLTANFSCCFYRRSALSLVPPSFFEERSAADWLFNLCVAYHAPLGFLRETLSVYRLNEGGQWTSLPEAQKEAKLTAAYLKFIEYFPDNISEISNHLPPPASDEELLKKALKQRTLGRRIQHHIDQIDLRYGCLLARGWVADLDHDSSQQDLKYILLLTEDDRVSIAIRTENVRRLDVKKHLEKKHASECKETEWCGFKSVAPLQTEDGSYRLAVGKIVSERLSYALTSFEIALSNGQAEVRRL